jgi:hypothetical protein
VRDGREHLVVDVNPQDSGFVQHGGNRFGESAHPGQDRLGETGWQAGAPACCD